MQISELASAIAKREGHKSQARIGDIREILSIIADMAYQNAEVLHCLTKLGIARKKRKKS